MADDQDETIRCVGHHGVAGEAATVLDVATNLLAHAMQTVPHPDCILVACVNADRGIITYRALLGVPAVDRLRKVIREVDAAIAERARFPGGQGR